MPAAIRFPSVLERTHRSRLACPSGSEKQVETSARGRDLGECCGLLAGETAPSTPSKKMALGRSEEPTSELQSLKRITYDVFCLKKKKSRHNRNIKVYIETHTIT